MAVASKSIPQSVDTSSFPDFNIQSTVLFPKSMLAMGERLGETTGLAEGRIDGVAFRLEEGEVDGDALGTVGDLLGLVDGDTVGNIVGLKDGWFEASWA